MKYRGFYQQGLTDCQSIQAIGYKEMYDFFNGKISEEEAIENLKQNSRRLCKETTNLVSE